MTAMAWIGYDTPRKLGDHENGGGLSLPIWINFMETAIKGVPVAEPSRPSRAWSTSAGSGTTTTTHRAEA